MTTAIVVFGEPTLLESAYTWARAGLIAPSVWVSSEDAAHVDPDHPNQLHARMISPGVVSESQPLFASISSLGQLDGARVLWVRSPGFTVTADMKPVEQLLREMLPPDDTHWLDIVVPRSRTDETMADLPGQWVQLRIEPEDRPAPNIGDAGWDLNLDVPIHSALAAAGALAGEFPAHWGKISAANHYSMRVFSRMILGARATAMHADEFVSRTLPDASAATFHQGTYIELRGGQSAGLLRDAEQFLVQTCSATLAYTDPPPTELARPPRLTLQQNIQLIFRFIGLALGTLVGADRRITRNAESMLRIEDLGYNVGRAPSSVFTTGSPLPDFDSADQRLADDARLALETRRRKLLEEPPLPDATVWRTVLQLCTSINDGGLSPDGWDPPKRYERRPVVGGDAVRPEPVEAILSEVPEFADAPNASVTAAALKAAAAERHRPLAPLESSSRAVARAQELITEGNSLDSARLRAQLDEIGVASSSSPTNLVDRVAARIVGAGLRARLDADRWTEFATQQSESTAAEWPAAQRKFRKHTLIVGSVGVGAGTIWALVRFLLTQLLPSSTTTMIGFVVIGSACALAFGALVFRLYAQYSAILERGRRRLEIRGAWFARAEVALFQAARLSSARRIYGAWSEILRCVFNSATLTSEQPDRQLPERLPRATAIAVAEMNLRSRTELLAASDVAKPGWRLRAIGQMASAMRGTNAQDAMTALLNDTGVDGGPLAEMRRDCPELWSRYADDLRRSVAEYLAEKMTTRSNSKVDVIVPTNRPVLTCGFDEFLSEPWPATQPYETSDDSQDFHIKASRSSSTEQVQFVDDILALGIRMQLRDLGPSRIDNADNDSNLDGAF